jgi:hypothetical protein
MPQISEEDFATLVRARDFLQEAATKPETRRAFEKMAKALRPDIQTTEDLAAEAAAPYLDEMKASQKRMDDWIEEQRAKEKAAEDAAADRKLNDAFGRLQADGYTAEGLEKIKKMMMDRNIPDPEAAAALFDKMNPKPMEGVSSWEPDHWDFEANAVDRDVKGLFSNPDKWADREVYSVLAEMRGQKATHNRGIN